MKRVFPLFTALLLMLVAVHAFSQSIPSSMNFQGRLAKPDGTPVSNGTYSLTFSLFGAATGGTALWQQASSSVTVLNGTFSAKLDFSTGFATGQTLDSVFAATPYLEIKIGTSAPLSPRQRLTSNAYALRSRLAENVVNGSITLSDLAPGVLNFSNISGQITGNQIAAETISLSNLSGSLQEELGKLTTIFGPALAGSVATGGSPKAVAVSGSYAYVVNFDTNTLQVFDVSDPASPAVKGSTGSGGFFPGSIAVSGNYAYVVNENSALLRVFNVSNPASPMLAGAAATGTTPVSLAVSGNYAYVVNYGSSTLQVFNVSNPASPTLAGSVGTAIGPDSVAVSGNYAYIVYSASNAMQVFNVSNPANPTWVGSVGTGASPYSVTVSGKYAYVVNEDSNTLQAFNVSNPTSPTLAGSIGTGATPYSVTVAGQYAYVVNASSNTLQIFSVFIAPTGFVTFTSVGSIGTGGFPKAVAVSGNYAHVVSGSNTLQVFDIFGTLQVHGNLAVTGHVGIGTPVASNVNLALPTIGAGAGNYSALIGAASDVGGDAEFSVGLPASSTHWPFLIGKGGNHLLAVAANGQVGIKTGVPSYDLDVNGTLRCFGFTNSSDARYKTHVLTLDHALDAILSLRGVAFEWDREQWKGRNFPEGRQIGFVAQEVEAVLPELVSTDREGYKSVAYANVVPVLVEAIKQQQKQIEKLKTQNARITLLEARLKQCDDRQAEIEELKRQMIELRTMALQNASGHH